MKKITSYQNLQEENNFFTPGKNDGTFNAGEGAKRFAIGGLRLSGRVRKFLPGFPSVTIVIAIFNGVEFLRETLDSILAQDYPNIELIIVDGGSTDGTIEILYEYEESIDYWVSELDAGISDAFNKAILQSSGNFINFQGAGDILTHPSVVSKAMSGVDGIKDMFVSARIQRVSENNSNEITAIVPRKFSVNFNKLSLLFKMALPHQGLFTNKKIFDMHGLFDTKLSYSMDYDHLLRIYKKFPSVIMKDVILSSWREGGVGSGKIMQVLNEYNKIKRKNQVAPIPLLILIDVYIKCKFYIKICLGFKG